ncbi:glutathione S-transferase family protein [Microvirga sp. 2TAF3]|uniref:glutathione S-transferase family protein n=1 Tax=Microvirga sp. 2TAF3 TaxID=3233014 RepID=UPI003F9826D9
MRLIVSNKAVSPWPFRAWLVLKSFEIPFEEVFLDLSLPQRKERLRAASPTGKVPVLIDGDIKIWESLSIIEYVAEKFPCRPIWPQDRGARAHARSIANEMHAGFSALREHCPMNMLRAPEPVELGSEVRADIDRVIEIWEETRTRFGVGGSFLYGAFSAADAMFAPIVSRFYSYGITVPRKARNYMRTVMSMSAWDEWQRDCEAAA